MFEQMFHTTTPFYCTIHLCETHLFTHPSYLVPHPFFGCCRTPPYSSSNKVLGGRTANAPSTFSQLLQERVQFGFRLVERFLRGQFAVHHLRQQRVNRVLHFILAHNDGRCDRACQRLEHSRAVRRRR